jgi:hypothetical protein
MKALRRQRSTKSSLQPQPEQLQLDKPPPEPKPEPEPEPEPEPKPEWVPEIAEVVGTYVLEGPGVAFGTFWSCSVIVSRAGGGRLDCDVVDHWTEPRGSRTDTYECSAEPIVGGIALTDRQTGRHYQAGIVDGGLRVNSALFPIAVSATFGAQSKYYVLDRITDPKQLIQEQRERAAKKDDKRDKGRLSISSVKRRAEARSRRVLLEQCLPPGERQRDASSPPATPQQRGEEQLPTPGLAVSPPDEPGRDGKGSNSPKAETPVRTGPLEFVGPGHERSSAHRHDAWAPNVGTQRPRMLAPLPAAATDISDDWPRVGPLVLRGDLATAAAAKSRAVERLDAGEFPQAVAELQTAQSFAGATDLELPVLLAQATAGTTAARGLTPSERSAWSRVYGPDEPVRPPKPAVDELVGFIDQIGAYMPQPRRAATVQRVRGRTSHRSRSAHHLMAVWVHVLGWLLQVSLPSQRASLV